MTKVKGRDMTIVRMTTEKDGKFCLKWECEDDPNSLRVISEWNGSFFGGKERVKGRQRNCLKGDELQTKRAILEEELEELEDEIATLKMKRHLYKDELVKVLNEIKAQKGSE